MNKLAVKYRPIISLQPYQNNSRTHSERQIAEVAASIMEFGFTNPLLIDEHSGIIAGHARLLAAETLEMDKVHPVNMFEPIDESP